ncbi:MAG: CamS family sex pheromone protein [Merdibacter sp.]
MRAGGVCAGRMRRPGSGQPFRDPDDATDGDYAAVLPFHASDARQKHTSVISDQGERFNIVTGLMELSKSHFNPNDVAFKESQFLTYDILDASDYSTGLLGRASDSNPDGLNQRRDESFDTEMAAAPTASRRSSTSMSWIGIPAAICPASRWRWSSPRKQWIPTTTA